MSNSSNAIDVQGLVVAYRGKRAVDGVSLGLKAGCGLGLLGPNGAGKTSTIRAILGILKPTEGDIRIFAEKPTEAHRWVGYVPENGALPEYLTVGEYLDFTGSYRIVDCRRRREAIGDLSGWLELETKTRISRLSHGMKRRVLLAQAFLGQVRLLVMDEPLGGLDPLMIIKVREWLERFRASGGTLVYSSHILAEVEKICSDVVMISFGRLICQSPVADLLTEYGSVEKAFASKMGKAENG